MAKNRKVNVTEETSNPDEPILTREGFRPPIEHQVEHQGHGKELGMLITKMEVDIAK